MARNAAIRTLLPSLLVWQLGCREAAEANRTDPLAPSSAPEDEPTSLDGSAPVRRSKREGFPPRPVESIDFAAIPAAEFLLGSYPDVVGTRCGLLGIETRGWLALRELVHFDDRDALHLIARSARTAEGRVLGIAGLYHTGEFDEVSAREALATLPGDVRTCGGCIFSSAPAESMMLFIVDATP